jgi:hypothetical protein
MTIPDPVFAVSIIAKDRGSLVRPVYPIVVDVVIDVELIMSSITSDL